jgi:hypothetical protein
MNPLSVESAIKTAFAASAFSNTTIYTATDYEEMTPESLNLIVSVAQLDHVVGDTYKAQTTIRIVSPALLGADAKTEMVTTINSVRNALANTYLAANWPITGAPTYGGVWVTGTKMSQDNHTWIAEVDAVIGVSV